MSLIKRVNDVTCHNPDVATHGNEILSGPARVLVNRALAAGDQSYGEVSADIWSTFRNNGERRLDTGTAAKLLLEKFPGLAPHIDAWKDKLCHLKPRSMVTDKVEIELVTTIDLPVDQGAPRRWNVDPLTAFLDMLPDCKGVIVENDSLASKNGAPLVVAVIQRGNEDWLGDLDKNKFFSFDGFRTIREQGPQKHADALKGLQDRVIHVPQRGVLVQGAQPDQTLFDFGSVVRLTAIDQVGNVIGVATVKPTNVQRNQFRRAGLDIRTEFLQGIDTTTPLVAKERVSLPTSLVIPRGQEGKMLGLGANIPSPLVRMDAKIGAQAITEPGAALELEVSGQRVVATSIPFSHGANINANEVAEMPRIHSAVTGNTYAEMMMQPAVLHANGTNPDGTVKGDGRPLTLKVADLALPERARITVAGTSMSKIPLNNDGLTIKAPDGVNLQDHLRGLGLEVVQEKIKDSTDQLFKVTVNPAFIGTNGDDKVRIGVGYETTEGKWVWSHDQHGCSEHEPDVRSLGRKAETFTVRVPDEVYRQGNDKTPAKLYVRIWRDDGKTPLFLAAANLDMKQIGRSMGQLSTAERIFEGMEKAKVDFEAGFNQAVGEGRVIAEPISAKEMEQRMAKGGAWSFQYGGHAFTVKKDPTNQTQEFHLYRGEQLIGHSPELVRTNAKDENVPTGYFMVNLTGVANGYALYVNPEEIRRAPLALPTKEGVAPQQARLEALTAKNAEQQSVYPNISWRGINAGGELLNSREDLQTFLDRQEAARQAALQELAKRRDCNDDCDKAKA